MLCARGELFELDLTGFRVDLDLGNLNAQRGFGPGFKILVKAVTLDRRFRHARNVTVAHARARRGAYGAVATESQRVPGNAQFLARSVDQLIFGVRRRQAGRVAENTRAAARADTGVGTDFAGVEGGNADFLERNLQLFGRHQPHRRMRARTLVEHRRGNRDIAFIIDSNQRMAFTA